jgi:hypothetical protein
MATHRIVGGVARITRYKILFPHVTISDTLIEHMPKIISGILFV